jgi:hypothetical protein
MMRLLLVTLAAASLAAQTREGSAESAWAKKKVLASRVLDDMTSPSRWTLSGRGELTFPTGGERRHLRLNVALQNATALPTASAVRSVAGEDWTGFNRLSFWLRTDPSGFPVLTLIMGIRNAGKTPVAAVHLRESGEHNVTVPNGVWTRVTWEIPHVARDRVTQLTFRPWVNKRLADPTDVAAIEIGPIELERVEADHYEGWNVAQGKIAFSHTGYELDAPKTAIASGLTATEFQVIEAGTGKVVLRKKVSRDSTPLGQFQVLEFSDTPAGTYRLRAGGITTPPFRVGENVWDTTIDKTIHFFHGQRCGMRIPGVHELCHRDWLATLGDKRIVMNGGWHDAGDLSQGLVNTGEATHAMFSLLSDLRAAGRKPEWLPGLADEALWGLDWVDKVRFPGGFRIGFASHNLWTDGIIGNEDDRTPAALNNPNANYIAAMAGAAAARYLATEDPDRARRALAIAEEDWRHAIVGVETPATLSTPAFASTEMESAAMGIIASVELYRETKKDEYARKAWELSRIVEESQQKTYVGTTLPLAGFFYTGPDRKTLFHQFHRGNDQAPVVAMAMLCDTFPDHPDWIRWYAVVARYSEYQKRSVEATAPYGVLPAYVYREDEWQTIAENDRYGSSREAFRQQVLAGTPMGGGWYLKAFPVWFTRRGNYGVLLSQTKALAAAARLRRDLAAYETVQAQLQWVLGRNPFAQSTMYGEGYDYHPQYSVSVGDLMGSLPVGMMTRDNGDAPYWPASNTYVFKEVWVHSSARWLAIMQDLNAPEPRLPLPFTVKQTTSANGEITIAIEVSGRGRHSFAIRADNLDVEGGAREINGAGRMTWKAKPRQAGAPWVAVVIVDGNAAHRRDVTN